MTALQPCAVSNILKWCGYTADPVWAGYVLIQYQNAKNYEQMVYEPH